MPWTTLSEPYLQFEEGASDPWNDPQFLRPLDMSMDIWEKPNSHVQGTWRKGTSDLGSPDPCELRIIFAPLDLSRNSAICLPIFNALKIPPAFVTERLQNVCHSFGTQQDANGSSCAWFHFLCKNLDVDYTGPLPRIVNRTPISPLVLQQLQKQRQQQQQQQQQQGSRRSTMDNLELIDLPHADHSWLRSGFFLRMEPGGTSTTLVCFGATPYVRERLEMWIESGAWDEVTEEPLALLDLVMCGLFREVDNAVWKMADVFGPMEYNILSFAKVGFPDFERQVQFVGLHNCLKHVIHLSEAIEACLLVMDGLKLAATTKSNSTITPSPPEPSAAITKTLLTCLSHRHSLFSSTRLRLSSLHRRIDNIIALCFNLVAQQDSMTLRHDSRMMRHDSSSMKIIAAITMVFLPTTAVASVIGSQLFLSTVKDDSEGGSWDVKTSPLFNTLWMVAGPLTLGVITMAASWNWYTHFTYPKTHEEIKKRSMKSQRSFRSR